MLRLQVQHYRSGVLRAPPLVAAALTIAIAIATAILATAILAAASKPLFCCLSVTSTVVGVVVVLLQEGLLSHGGVGLQVGAGVGQGVGAHRERGQDKRPVGEQRRRRPAHRLLEWGEECNEWC